MRPKNALSARRREQALALVREGKSSWEAARATGAGQSTIVRWARQAGTPLPRSRVHHPPEMREQCLRLRRQGWKGSAIAARLGVSENCVSRWICIAEGRVGPPRPKRSPRAMEVAMETLEPDIPGCPRCGLRGEHGCLAGDATSRRYVEPLW